MPTATGESGGPPAERVGCELEVGWEESRPAEDGVGGGAADPRREGVEKASAELEADAEAGVRGGVSGV